MKLLMISSFPASLINFRGDLIRCLSKRNVSVVALSSGASKQEVEEILQIVDEYHDYKISRNSIDPIQDLIAIFKFVIAYAKHRPDIVVAYTIKPVVYGGIAARLIGFSNFNALITGLGFGFQKGGIRKNILVKLISFLYRFSLKNAKTITFQNKDNLDYFVTNKLVDKDRCYLVNGSGVNLEQFKPSSVKVASCKFLLIARLLEDKGIREYAKAAELTKVNYPEAEFHLVGPEDPSPNGISIEEVMQWHNNGVLTYHGESKDVRPYIAQAGVFVLPSYHEGLPRTVLEAMAMAKPILTTDVPGCRETVENGINGWLVEKGEVVELADKMSWFIEHQEASIAMGKRSEKMVKEKFDVHKVNEELLNILQVHNEKDV